MIAREPMATRKLAQLAGLEDGTRARTIVRRLNRLYDAEGRSFRIVEVGGGFLAMTRAKFAPWLRRLHGTQGEIRLSGPAMETLAVVAYRQPVLRADIEAIRGVQCGEMLRQLMERDLIKISGRSEELGRPFLYGTTKYFLQVFGLRHLDELPKLDQFSLGQIISEQPQNNTEEFPVTMLAEPESQTSAHPEEELLLVEAEPVQSELEEDEDVYEEEDGEEEYEYVDEDVDDEEDDEEDEEDEDEYEYYDDEDEEEVEEDEEDEDEEDEDEEEDEDIWEEVEDDDDEEEDDEESTWEEEWEYEDEEDEEEEYDEDDDDEDGDDEDGDDEDGDDEDDGDDEEGDDEEN